MYAVLVSSATNTLGEKEVPLCEPSQNGCLLEFPQEHHAYVFPASSSTAIGVLPATVGLSMDFFVLRLSKDR